jgi:hypothetical protein
MLLNLIDVVTSALGPVVYYVYNLHDATDVFSNVDQRINLYIATAISDLLTAIGFEVLIYHVCMKRQQLHVS